MARIRSQASVCRSMATRRERSNFDHPLGKRGPELFQWFFPTRTFREMQGEAGGERGTDDEFARRSMDGFGAYILGRNMFGPIRGEWPDDQWRGRWGDDPPYHAPTFVLTHHPRASIEMDGGTTFHFVTDGIEAALQRAREAAGHKDIKIGGGVGTVRQYIRAGQVDEIHLAVAPVVLGQGEALFEGLDLRALGHRTDGARAHGARHARGADTMTHGLRLDSEHHGARTGRTGTPGRSIDRSRPTRGHPCRVPAG